MTAETTPTARTFRKKPVEVTAMLFNGDRDSGFAIIEWAHRGLDPMTNAIVRFADLAGYHMLLIRTLEGDMRAVRGDWIIRGVKGEFYPCKPDIFAATYEPAADALQASAAPAEDCRWIRRDDEYGYEYWDTSCGGEFAFGLRGVTPEHAAWKCCIRCGKPIRTVLGVVVSAVPPAAPQEPTR